MDPHELEKQFNETLERAHGASAVVVEAVERQQAGQTYLQGRCPRCSTPMALSGEGKQLCRKCGLWLHYKRKQ